MYTNFYFNNFFIFAVILFIVHDQVEERTKVLVEILEVFRDKYDISLRTNATIIFGWGAFGQAKINQPCPPTQGTYCQGETWRMGVFAFVSIYSMHLFLLEFDLLWFTACICFWVYLCINCQLKVASYRSWICAAPFSATLICFAKPRANLKFQY